MSNFDESTKVTISNNPYIYDLHATIEEIFMLIKNEKDLSFRKKNELVKLAKNKQIACLFVENKLAGFLISHKLSQRLIEINGLFIKTEFRGNNLSSLLINNVIANKKYCYFAATFLKNIEKILEKHGFEKTNLHYLTFREKIAFFNQRFHPHRIKEVLRHKKSHSLIFMKK